MSNNAHFSHDTFQLGKRRIMDSALANLTLESKGVSDVLRVS